MNQSTREPAGIPRWVKLVGIIVAVVILLVIVVMLAGGGHQPRPHSGGV